jgi:anaerobic ribonucleoside-triphosphate reductase activating protein
MLISRVQHPVLALGFGRRAGVWTQGCALGCDGCVAQDTWPADQDKDVPVDDVLDWVGAHPDIDGVTVSGGEPLDQPEDLRTLLSGLRALLPERVDILCFSGRTRRAIERAFPDVIDLADAWVLGPYRRDQPTCHPLMGSANQEVLTVTELGRSRYGNLTETDHRPVQVSVIGQQMWIVGIPSSGDIGHFEAAAQAQGLGLIDPSWRQAET